MCHKSLVLPVKKWLKSVHIYGSYRKNKTGTVFLDHPVYSLVDLWVIAEIWKKKQLHIIMLTYGKRRSGHFLGHIVYMCWFSVFCYYHRHHNEINNPQPLGTDLPACFKHPQSPVLSEHRLPPHFTTVIYFCSIPHVSVSLAPNPCLDRLQNHCSDLQRLQ